jgi:hypothetical protein
LSSCADYSDSTASLRTVHVRKMSVRPSTQRCLPSQGSAAPSPKLLPDGIPTAQAMPMAVESPTTVTARTNSFVDDLIRVFLDTPLNREREPHAVPLAIHVTSRPHFRVDEPVQRRKIASAPKLKAEESPAELQIVLGWLLNCRLLMILLPNDNFEAWSADLRAIVAASKRTNGELESKLERLNHVAYIMPLARHFLNNFRLSLHHH